MSNKKVLIITYYWPPSGGVGVQRWLHFAINLKKLGWEPVVFTPSNPQFEITDKSLENLVKDIEVIKRPIWEPFGLFHKLTGSREKKSVQQGTAMEKSQKSIKDRLIVWLRGNLFVPDARLFWIKPASKFLSKYIPVNGVTTIVTTGPPHSMHLIGLRLKRDLPQLKWIADFRDPWSDWDILTKLQTGRRAMRKHKKLERAVLQNADRAITVSLRLAQSLSEKADPKRQIDIVMNGVSVSTLAKTRPEKSESKFVIGYFGMLNELRNPEMLWQTLNQLCATNQLFNERVEVRLGGIVSDSIVQELKQSEYLSSKVKFLGYLNHSEVFEAYNQFNLLLLLLNKSDNAKWILPVKFFEYLSSLKPILTFGPVESDLGDIVSQHQIGKIMRGDDISEISQFILSIFDSKYDFDVKVSQSLLEKFSRESQTKELAHLMNDL